MRMLLGVNRNNMAIICWICYDFSGTSLRRVLRHIHSVHSHDANFRVVCGINGCPRRYKKFPSFKKHIYRHHKAEIHKPNINILLDSTVHTHEEEDIQLEDFALNQVLVNNEGDDVNKQDPVIQKKVAALFLLKLKEIHKVSQTALLGIVDDINELVQHRIQSIEIEVMLYLSSNGVSQDICNELQKIFRVGQSISFLNTTYLQQKYYKEYLGLLVSTCLCMYVCIFGRPVQ